ncbi:Uncharacterised protein [Acinetobacter baumannii]|nr:Uncharacterised protein [Acinetobacter baumannii]
MFETPCGCAVTTGTGLLFGWTELIFKMKVLPSTRVVNAPASFKFTVKRER